MPKKFRSIREKNGSHGRSKSSEPGHKVHTTPGFVLILAYYQRNTVLTIVQSRPMSSETFFSIFKTEATKQAERAEKQKEEEERENLKARMPTTEQMTKIH